MRTQLSVVIVAFALTSASTAAAQVANTGSVQVIVEDSDGGRLPGVTVSAEAADTITRRTAVTDAEGVASLEALAPSAQYVITAELQGFGTGRQQQILVRVGQSATLTLTLSIAGLTEAVQVVAATPLVDVRSASTGQDITLQLTESLPTDRSYQS